MAHSATPSGSVGDARASLLLPVEGSDDSGTSAKTKGPLNDELKEFVDLTREHYWVPGVSIGVVNGDETYLCESVFSCPCHAWGATHDKQAYGHASVDPNVDATPDTLFYIGSVTKGILAATLLHTLESTAKSGTPIALETKIRDIIPDDFVTTDEYATYHATLKDAVYHRLGYPRHDFSYGGPGFTVKDAVRSLRQLPMSAELREKCQYFNMGYQTLQHVIETITGKWCGDVYEAAVFKPLGMSSTTAELQKAQELPHTLASGYANSPAKDPNPQPWWNSRLIGEGGVISNVQDMVKYVRAVMTQTGLPISEGSHKALFAPGMIGAGSPPKHQSAQLFAAGWIITSYRGPRFIQHGGAVPGFASQVGFLPDLKWGTVVLTNGDLGGIAGSEAILYRLMDDFLGVPADDRLDYVEKWDGIQKFKESEYAKARYKIFPSVPSPQLPRSLTLDQYAGTYSHPGYRTLTFSVAKPESDIPVAEGTSQILHAIKEQSEWEVVFDLEHVSGEHFICYINTLARSTMAKIVQDPCAAEFKVGPDGRVSRLSIQIESSLGEIWFERV